MVSNDTGGRVVAQKFEPIWALLAFVFFSAVGVRFALKPVFFVLTAVVKVVGKPGVRLHVGPAYEAVSN